MIQQSTSGLNEMNEMKSETLRDIFNLVFIIALFIVGKIGKQPKISWTDQWIKKM